MRGFLATSICIAFLAGAAPSSARQERSPDAWTGSYQVADAAWVVHEGRGYVMYLVFAENVSGPNPEAHTSVFLGKGSCRVRPGEAPKRASCSVQGRFRRIDADSFVIEPSLSGAGLSLPGVRVHWSDPEGPEPDYNVYADAPFIDLEAEVKRPTSAAGRILGTRLRQRDLRFARLAQGVFGGGDPSGIPQGPVRFTVRVDL